MQLDLNEEQADTLAIELRDIIDRDRFPFSQRTRTLKEILGKIRPEPTHEALPPPKRYEPPRGTAARRRRRG